MGGWQEEGGRVYTVTASSGPDSPGGAMTSNNGSSKKPGVTQGLWPVALGALLGAMLTTALFTQQGEHEMHRRHAGFAAVVSFGRGWRFAAASASHRDALHATCQAMNDGDCCHGGCVQDAHCFRGWPACTGPPRPQRKAALRPRRPTLSPAPSRASRSGCGCVPPLPAIVCNELV